MKKQITTALLSCILVGISSMHAQQQKKGQPAAKKATYQKPAHTNNKNAAAQEWIKKNRNKVQFLAEIFVIALKEHIFCNDNGFSSPAYCLTPNNRHYNSFMDLPEHVRTYVAEQFAIKNSGVFIYFSAKACKNRRSDAFGDGYIISDDTTRKISPKGTNLIIDNLINNKPIKQLKKTLIKIEKLPKKSAFDLYWD